MSKLSVMNNIWKRICRSGLLCVGIIVLMTGCVDSTQLDVPVEQPVEAETGMIAFRINLDVTNIETRWGGSMTSEIGTKLETEVQKVRLVLYGENDAKTDWVVRYAYDFNIRSVGNATAWTGFEQYDVASGTKNHLYSATADGFITFARPVKWDDYKMLMIINPTKKGTSSDAVITTAHDLYEVTDIGKSVTLLNTAVTYPYTTQAQYDNLIKDPKNCGPAATTNTNMNGYFLMTNHQDLVNVSKLEGAKHIHATEQGANDNPVPVYVSRVVAKTTVKQGSAFAVLPSNASVASGSLKWGLDVINKKTYWMRKMTNLILETGGKGAMETQSYSGLEDNRRAMYAEDPNFSNWYASNVSNLDANFLNMKTISPSGTPTLLKVVAANGATSPAVEYSLENTLDESQVLSEVTTQVLVSCNYIPSGFSASESYFVYNGNIAIKRSVMIGYAANPSTIPSALEGLADAISFAKSRGINFTDGTLIASFQIGALGYYQGGISYYKIPVRHTGDDSASEASYGYYGMVRNYHYVVEIKSIKGPGIPVIEIPDNGNVAFKVVINNWKNRQQSNVVGW